jgi:hypothetical protein
MYAEVLFTVAPSYNTAPQTIKPVIRLNRETGTREAAMSVIDCSSRPPGPSRVQLIA